FSNHAFAIKIQLFFKFNKRTLDKYACIYVQWVQIITNLLWRMSWIRSLERIAQINTIFISLAGVSFFTLDTFISKIVLSSFLMS
ncbi:MAG: hypothetical protein MJA31_00525, partial [Clostridia bacterium]|nr:hypothetical protein [Clostridia bacterium]